MDAVHSEFCIIAKIPFIFNANAIHTFQCNTNHSRFPLPYNLG